MFVIYILPEVWRQNFWLGLFSGAASPKPLILSNSPFIRGLNLGAMTSETKKRNNFVKTTCAFAENKAYKPLDWLWLFCILGMCQGAV